MNNMNRRFAMFLAGSALALTTATISQAQTLARLAREATPDLPHSGTISNGPHHPSVTRGAALPESQLSRLAARALFVDSNPGRARLLAARALQSDPQDAEALFVRMEVAGMEANDAIKLDAAIRLCELGANAQSDPRMQLAVARVRESAANTPDFRSALPRLQALLANSQGGWAGLHEALLNAAMDGAPRLDPYAISRGAGILTDWRIVGPLGLHPLLDQQPISPTDDLAQASYQNRLVENFQFPDGRILLPNYFSRRGVFYAATNFASLSAESLAVRMESARAVEVYADGRRVLRTDGRGRSGAIFEVSAGPHRILLKFVGSTTPLRIAVSKAEEQVQVLPPRKSSLQELTYVLAAEHYAAGEYGSAVQQITSVPSSDSSAALQFLLAQSRTRSSPTMSEYATAWYKLRVRGAAADDEASLWARRIAAHPSCETLRSAMGFYRERGQFTEARAAQQRLNGCAPESLDYAQSLSDEGNHAEAAFSLQGLLAAAPLNRAAREMLVRELQFSGDDAAAQAAAAEWLRIAPNAGDYHRLAAGPAVAESGAGSILPVADFYATYRRDATAIARESASVPYSGDTVLLLDDHVAISRADGSVSLYIHSARRVLNPRAAEQFGSVRLPQGSQLVALRVIHADGSATRIDSAIQGSAVVLSALVAGDAVDEEYVIHYSGDGGIPEHSEAFQFVFGSFNERVLHARFVALIPAGRADRGVVIGTGETPTMTAKVCDGMLERVWETPIGEDAFSASANGLAIVRVVEQENGWSVPSSAEHKRRIETIHPGPRAEES
jgi:tetratricopeptide (TPR) repeat protein